MLLRWVRLRRISSAHGKTLAARAVPELQQKCHIGHACMLQPCQAVSNKLFSCTCCTWSNPTLNPNSTQP